MGKQDPQMWLAVHESFSHPLVVMIFAESDVRQKRHHEVRVVQRVIMGTLVEFKTDGNRLSTEFCINKSEISILQTVDEYYSFTLCVLNIFDIKYVIIYIMYELHYTGKGNS